LVVCERPKSCFVSNACDGDLPARVTNALTHRCETRQWGGRDMALAKPILVVDDDPVSCQLISEILTEHGYDAEWATSTAAALENILERDYRLVVTDVFMPGVGGTVLAWHLRQLRPDLPILLITAFPSQTTEADARALGVSLLAKPFVPDALIERVCKLVGNGAGKDGDRGK